MQEEQHSRLRRLGNVSGAPGSESLCHVPMPLGSERALLLVAFGVCSPPTMVDVEDERLKVLASGAR